MPKKVKAFRAKKTATKSPVRSGTKKQPGKLSPTSKARAAKKNTQKKPAKRSAVRTTVKKKPNAPQATPRWAATVVCEDDPIGDLLAALQIAKRYGRRVELIRASDWFYRQVTERIQHFARLKGIREPLRPTRDVIAPVIAVLALDDMSEMQVLPRANYELTSRAGLSIYAAFMEMVKEGNARGGARRYVVPPSIYDAILASPQARRAPSQMNEVRVGSRQTTITLDGHAVTLEYRDLFPSSRQAESSNARLTFTEE